MRIVDIREAAVPLNSTLRNAVFDFSEMTTSVVAVITDVVRDGRPVAGFAFNSTGRYACGPVMRARMIPRILKTDADALLNAAGDNIDPEKCLAVMLRGEKPGGHTERSIAVGTIEVAIWDAVAKIAGQPLHATIADRYNGGKTVDRMFCYVGGGWYAPGKGIPELVDEMKAYLGMGYTQLKMKVGGMSLADDLARLEAVLAILDSPDRLAVDANCGFSRERALEYGRALAPYKLRWFEEPVDPLDYATVAELADFYESPLATGENLFSTSDVVNLVRYSGMRPDRDVVQTDTPQSYGIATLAKTIAAIADYGWNPVQLMPHGGNQMSLHIAGGFGLGLCEAYPNVFGVFSGYADDATLDDGYLTMPSRPGIGFEAQNALYAVMRELAA
jgi:L-alanine-DL-glutamate epimerase-like enolase superfamily enzyme